VWQGKAFRLEVNERDYKERSMKKQNPLPVPEKPGGDPPYPPGTRYGLAKRKNLKVAEKPGGDPPYPPGTRYGLLKRKNLR
jgi:hypothetical protein